MAAKRRSKERWAAVYAALALAGMVSSAAAEREPAALARARARAEARATVQHATIDELEGAPPDAERENELGRDAAPDPANAPSTDTEPDTEAGVDAEPTTASEAEPAPAAESAPRPAPARNAPSPARRRARPPSPPVANPPAPAPRKAPQATDAPGFEHVVADGETLGAIANRYGTGLQALLDQNPGLDADRIRAGQRIVIDGDRKLVRYTVQPGDTLTGIARAQRVSIAELLRWNPNVKPDRIRDGVELRIFPRAPASPSASIGSPSAGRLISGRRLQPGPGFVVRSSDRAWGTDETVRELIAAFSSLQRAFPRSPRVWVHDLSLRSGGPIDDHHSHQSGRDADIAYVQRSCESSCGFRPLSSSDLDARRTWALLRYWLERDALEAVFIDYRLQAPLYRAARADGASAEELQRWFQYPRGRGNPWGVIRHYPKHGDHMHVRFACHSTDPECKTFRPLLTHTASR